MDFVLRLFDTTDFPARWVCGRWTAGLGWLHILSDLGVWSAYLAIPLVLAFFTVRRRDLPFRRIFLLFVAFILLCGMTHLMEAIIFWWPAYRLAGMLKLSTAIVSWATVFALYRVIPSVLALRSPEELEREINARIQAETALREANLKLEKRVQERTKALTLSDTLMKEERNRFEITLGSIGDAVVAVDVNQRVTFMNHVAEALTGWTAVEAVEQPLSDVMRLVNQGTRTDLENPAIQALSQGTVVGLSDDALLLAKDGFERPVEDSAAPIRDSQGRIIGVVIVFRDVTNRRLAEEAIRQSERNFRTMADSIPQMAWRAAANGDLEWYNRRWYDFTGTSLDEMKGWGWKPLIHPDALPAVVDRWKDSLATGNSFEMIFPIRGKAGEFRQFLTRVEPVKDDAGAVTRWFGTNTDVSEAKRAEDQLRESRERLNFALNAAELGQWDLCLLDGSAERTLRHDQIFGYSTLRSEWSYSIFLEHVLSDDRDRVKASFQETTTTGSPLNIECRIRRVDGAVRWIWVKARVLENETGAFERLLGIVSDITERKKLEEELRQLATELSAADHRKDEFLATLAHELRNPLAPIRYGLQILQHTEIGAAEFDDLRSMMERQLRQLIRLVDDLLDVSRITSNKLELRLSRVDLRDVISIAMETSRPLMTAHGHELTVAVPDQPLILMADETRLAQVISNLLNNAAKYTRQNGHIQLTVSRRDRQIWISVKDDGIGISAEMLPRVFEMFTQVDHGLEPTQGGLGIGLTLVKRLVEMHGGSVEGRSDGLGKGSEFVVKLPDQQSRESDIVVSSVPSAESAPPAQQRVLIVEDNRDSARMLQMLLLLSGSEVRMAYDGLEAIEAANDFRPDVVLMDIGLPKLNGYEACSRIRQQPWSEKTLIIACTGWGQEDDIERSMQNGFDLHMTKPVDADLLAKAIASPRRKG